MKTTLYYNIFQGTLILLLVFTDCLAQLNISQKKSTLDFRPVTSGKLTFWESSTHASDTGYSNLSVFDGKRVSVLDRSVYGTSYEVHVSGNSAIYKRFYSTGALFHYKDGTITPLGTSLNKPSANTALISGNNTVWVKADGTELGFYNGTDISEIGINPFDSRDKTLLSLDGNTLVYQTGGGDYVLTQWVTAPFNQLSFEDDNNFIIRMNTYSHPSGFYTREKKYVWVENDGTDSEIFYYNSEQKNFSVQQITNNTAGDTLPVIGADGQIAWFGLENGVAQVKLYNDGQVTTLTGSSTEKNNLKFSGNLLTWLEKIPDTYYGHDLFAYNGTSLAKLNTKIVSTIPGYDGTSASEKYIVWREDSCVCYSDGKVKKQLPILGSDFTDPQISGSTLVWIKYYGEDVYMFDLDNGDISTYKIEPVNLDKCQHSKIANVFFTSKDSLPDGLIGLDFKIMYDTSLFVPTGKFKLPSDTGYIHAALNTAEQGKVFVSIYLQSAPEGHYISGKGKLIDIEFNQKEIVIDSSACFTSSQVEQSFIASSFSTYPADTGFVQISGNLTAQLLYLGDSAKKIIFDKENPGKYIPTDILFYTSSFCRPPAISASQPDVYGNFVLPQQTALDFSISRDIPGDTTESLTNVMAVINSADRNKALSIANYSYPDPSITELLAADVNLDGKVTAGDVSLISSRTINIYNEFPQQGNYFWDGSKYIPGPAYVKSKDWLFVDSIQLSYFDAQHPSRAAVPAVPDCLFNNALDSKCSLYFLGIMLGDVTHSWKTTDGENLRSAAENKVVFDFAHPIIEGGNYYSIPVKVVSAGKVTGLDLTLAYDNKKLSIGAVYKNEKYTALGFEYKDVLSRQLKVTSYDEQGFEADEAILYIRCITGDPVSLSLTANLINAYINGEEVPVETDVITSVSARSSGGNFQLVPNPSSGLVSIQSTQISGHVKIEILTVSGVLQKTVMALTDGSMLSKDLDLNDLNPGAYLVKVISENNVSVEKLVRY